MKENEIDLKEEMRTILRFYEQRLDSCTMAELKSAVKMFTNNMELDGTIDDFAEFYGKSRDAVYGVIKRKLVAKPKRNVVLYPFHAFRKIAPKSWGRKKD